ncbi:MAG: DUF5615 family PIN-like protein [Planctomycetes bacterium]|nr:DUF5615 family PIN-like protein [Planctomycetota bacterium]
MRFLIDRCAGHLLAEWLRARGHDVAESRDRGPDPGDRAVLGWAHAEGRVLITLDKDFGALIFGQSAPHSGLIRLPDVPAAVRITMMERVLDRHEADLMSSAVITVRGWRIRISRSEKSP